MKHVLVFVVTVVAVGCSFPAFADLDAGLAALRRQDYKTTFNEFEAAAKMGNPFAQKSLGLLYIQGAGTTKSYTKAIAWYRKAAAQGDGEAMDALGNLYAYGLGVKQDMPMAVEWLRKAMEVGTYAYPQNIPGVSDDPATKKRFDDSVAVTLEAFRRKAEQGDISAQVNLGYMYMVSLCTTRENTEENQSQAAGWIRKAAEAGHVGAQTLLGFMYAMEMIGERDQVQAAKWYQLAANQGGAHAQYMLAVMYSGTSGMKYSAAKSVPKDIGKAKELAAKAAQHGIAKAQTLIGALLLKTGTSEKDYSEALSWLRKSATQADPDAHVLIGDSYVSGAGVNKDFAQAIAYYRKAIDNSGSKAAYARLAHMYEVGLGVPQDSPQALQLYEKAADTFADAQLHAKLGRMYEDGVGTKKDGSKAVQHYASAAVGGDIESMRKLIDVYAKGLLGQKLDPEKVKYWKERLSKEGNSK
jgi:TPR repeat protein